MTAWTVVFLAAATLAVLGTPVSAASNFTDVDILNFALNLECLEAEFYSWVAYGEGIASVNSSLVGNSSAGLTTSNSGGQARTGTFSDTTIAIATEIAENEIAHVHYLRAAITAAGGTADNCPQLSLSPTTFTTAAKAALSSAGITLASTTSTTAFNPYSSEAAFFIGAFIFEDVGVTAYKGAVQVLQSSTYATVAAGIGAVEAGHAAIIRSQLYPIRTASTGLETSASPAAAINVLQAVNAITVLRDTLGGTTSSSVENTLTRTTSTFTGVTGGTADSPDLFAADPTTSVAFTRIPKQVLNIVYFDTTTTAGGFFPNGISGNNHIINATGTATTDACSGAISMASLSAIVPVLLTGVAVMCGLLW